MKLVVRQYVQSLKERGELDLLLPHILSEIGYEIIHHPRRGTRQAGVDVAAVGPCPHPDGEKTLYLFLIKPGNLSRSDWDGSLQAVRPSLNEIRDDYIPNRIPDQFSKLPISICICIGGELTEEVRSQWRGFVEQNTTETTHYQEWNGDRLSNLILSGLLSEELLIVDHRAAFQKAVAMVSEPETSYYYFRSLAFDLTKEIGDDSLSTTRLRQLLICLWILVKNGIEAGNLEAPYKTCELALLFVWDALNRSIEGKNSEKVARCEIFDELLRLYLSIGNKLINGKIGLYAHCKLALSYAARSSLALDVNLALFESMGRASLLGLWHYFIGKSAEEEHRSTHLKLSDKFLDVAISLINNNPTLNTPVRDDHHVEIGLFMLLSQKRNAISRVDMYLRKVAYQLFYRYRRREFWPTHFLEYPKLARHPVDRSDEYFRKSTMGSVLVPFMQVALERVGAKEELSLLISTISEELAEMTQQVWVPNDKTDIFIWRNGTSEGTGIPVSPMKINEQKKTSLSNQVNHINKRFTAIDEMSDTESGLLVPMLLLACRHHRLPLPPHLWFQQNGKET